MLQSCLKRQPSGVLPLLPKPSPIPKRVWRYRVSTHHNVLKLSRLPQSRKIRVLVAMAAPLPTSSSPVEVRPSEKRWSWSSGGADHTCTARGNESATWRRWIQQKPRPRQRSGSTCKTRKYPLVGTGRRFWRRNVALSMSMATDLTPVRSNERTSMHPPRRKNVFPPTLSK